MLRVIGDVHGHISKYQFIASQAENSLQVGDMGFNYDLLTLDPLHHKFIGGNHDNYGTYDDCDNALGHGGYAGLGGIFFFFVRGGFSLDKEYRTAGVDYFPEEEMSQLELDRLIFAYKYLQPKIMITHEAPKEFTDRITNPGILEYFGFNPETFTTRTQEALQVMFEAHQPDLWIFGHHHKSIWELYKGTQFVCLAEHEPIDLFPDGHVERANGEIRHGAFFA